MSGLHRSKKRLLIPVRLAAVLTVLAGSATFAETGPEPPSHPEARRGFVPGPLSPAPAAVAGHLHPPEAGAAVSGDGPVVVRFTDVAVPAVPAMEAPIRSHVQGEVLQFEGGVDLIGAPPAWPAPSIDASRPDAGGLAAKASARGFEGLAGTGFSPPDPVVAIGPGHVVEAVNSGYAVYARTGAVLEGYTSFDSFLDSVKPAGWSGFMFDPRLLFSAEHQKFVILVLGLDQMNQASYVFIAISQTTDPSGAWWLWSFDTHSDFAGFTADAWLDFAGLGADTWGLYVTGNYFFWTGGFKYSTVVSFSPEMFTGGEPAGWQFVDLRWPSASLAFALQPALPLSVAGGEETFFVNSRDGFGSQLLLWTLTGDRAAGPTLVRSPVNVASYQALGPNVDQPGSSTDIDGGDSRIMNAFYAQRRIYAALTSDTNGNASSSGAFLAKLNVDSKVAEWNTTLDGGAGWYYFFPAIVIGDPLSTSPPVSVFLSWTRPSDGVFASSAVRTYSAPPDDVSGPFQATALGLEPYVVLDATLRNRWGDYSGAGYDWQNRSMWGVTEYAGTSDNWRTRIDEVGGSIFTDGFESGNTSAWSAAVP